LQQPNGIAFQLFDARATPLLRDEEYADDVVAKVTADSMEELAGLLRERGLGDPRQFVETVEAYNRAVGAHADETRGGAGGAEALWDPAVKDGLSTFSSSAGLDIPKSNWAMPLSKAPFTAVKITCGITFTFGGLKVNPETAGVISSVSSEPISGLYAAGETVGGVFYGNYPGGSGLTLGTVLGRISGQHAANHARRQAGGEYSPNL
jgi:hypothetical protein